MSTSPLASICIPLYNKKELLAKTVEALLKQTYTPLEIVISDNGSTDGSTEIAQEFARRDSRVRYFRLENTVSINESWRYCFRLARGEFLKLHSGDDPALPADFLQRMIEPMLRQAAVEFTVCAIEPVVEYTWMGTSSQAQANYHGRVAQVNRELTALADRDARARKLLETSSFANWVGTPYAVVCRRSCLPESSWRKMRSPYGWPESYADWDFNIRLFLNHRGLFVEGITSKMYYDSNNAYARSVVDSMYELFDQVDQVLFPLTILIDPELVAIRLQARPDELATLIQSVQGRIQSLMDFSDEVVAFDHPGITARVLPRIYQTADTLHRNSGDYFAAKKMRQLRMSLVQHWLKTAPARIREEYQGDFGRAHCWIIESGLRQAGLDVREVKIVDKTFEELTKEPTAEASWGRWLALVLLTNFQSRPALKLEKVPEWLRADFGKYAWAAF